MQTPIRTVEGALGTAYLFFEGDAPHGCLNEGREEAFSNITWIVDLPLLRDPEGGTTGQFAVTWLNLKHAAFQDARFGAYFAGADYLLQVRGAYGPASTPPNLEAFEGFSEPIWQDKRDNCAAADAHMWLWVQGLLSGDLPIDEGASAEWLGKVAQQAREMAGQPLDYGGTEPEPMPTLL